MIITETTTVHGTEYYADKVISFGFADDKGRALGYRTGWIRVNTYDATGGFRGECVPTRNGERYGSSTTVLAPTLEAFYAKAEKMAAGARARYAKKFAAK